MADVYIDITDLVTFTHAYGRVTGIQRVQERILYELAQTPACDHIWCLKAADTRGYYEACRLSDLYEPGCSTLLNSLAGLGGNRPNGRWPSRMQVREYLNLRGSRGLRRVVDKLGVYARASFSPSTLETLGTVRPGSRPVKVVGLDQVPRQATVVLFGAGWNDGRVLFLAARHAEARGQVVQFVYDLIPIKHPEYFDSCLQHAFASFFDTTLRHVSQFVCISENTRRDLEDILTAKGAGVPSSVLPLAHEFPGYPRNARGCRPNDGLLDRFRRLGQKFVLCVGTLEIRKNGLALLQAWQELESLLGAETPHLVFCGRQGWKMDPFYSLLESSPWLQSRVHIVPTASDADIAFLHEHSIFSIYPSLYEGWGLPVGEAAWFGRTCITSRESSLPEICGMLADYVDPRNPPEIARAVHRAVTDRARLQLREKLIRQAPLRTWRDVAWSFYETVSGNVETGFNATTQRPLRPMRQAA
jgi:glycosyltransferase involved in cell wall biosynthesis